METIKLLKPEGLINSPAFSHVAVIPPGATTILVGGQNAVDANGALVGGDDIGAQTAQVMANLKTALAAAGADMSDVVSLTLYAVDGIDLTAGYAVAAQSLDPNSDPPLITAAMVPALGVPGALVELAAVAAVQR
ncbi:enamine deaminase RidA (YjgF/YER057c/UK114 family) [Williamsia limnetica]|jgi:enamine deaminase RidA (YjgF/YER057c/UK114 family)|uniref:Enamine deaminase RidA (YjgF/YER057c/UK114 family) n=1 Tax=Williamsia limnetica TaxID=882452 RepID=A0A318RRB5_WILLI|nr:RidA family protein [Williamsia limnetica]PYE20776.1 enamine deaminase RidA (YjgF/YER057c/UK114 family) [Williamsia limnetica]